MSRWRLAGGVLLVSVGAACATAGPPALPATLAYPDIPALVVPESLVADAQVLARHEAGWRRLQSGDPSGAARDFQAAVTRLPPFYPSEAGLGLVAFVQRRFEDAATRFDRVLTVNPAYRPALQGRVETALSAGDDAAAIQALEAWAEVEAEEGPREELLSRLDLLRLRALQEQLAAAAEARQAGRLEEAQIRLERARVVAPGSAVVLRELARIELQRGAYDAAEGHAREALELDPGDPDSHAALGEVLADLGRLIEAAAAYRRAAEIESRPAWRSRAETLASRAALAALPAEYREIPSAQSLTRGQLAALVGVRLEAALAGVPRRSAVILTDVREHWAASWIVTVTRAGIMDPLPNHAFQPGAAVRRADLAQAVWRAIQLVGARRPGELREWRSQRPRLPDVPPAHLAYEAIAAVLASGAMSTLPDGAFGPGRVVSGAEAVAALARVEQITGLTERRP